MTKSEKPATESAGICSTMPFQEKNDAVAAKVCICTFKVFFSYFHE